MKKFLPVAILVVGVLGLLSYISIASQSTGASPSATPARVGGPRGPIIQNGSEVTFSQLVEAVKRGEIASLRISAGSVVATTADEGIFSLYFGEGDLIEKLVSFGVTEGQLAVIEITYVKPTPAWIFPVIIYVFIGGVILIIFLNRKSAAGGGGGPSGPLGAFGRSGAKMVAPDQPKVTFEDVAGVEEAKTELIEVVDFLKDPKKFIALGAHIPKGVILHGPPGCGKTLMARAVAGEAGVPFFSISGSQFVEMYVGIGASRVRDLFSEAKRHAPCILFVDEIDAVGARRTPGISGGHQEANQTLNELLAQMDGFEANTNIVVIAATNRLDVLDPALLRPGRFDRRVMVDRPDVAAREKIFAVHTRGKPLSADVNIKVLAAATPGFSGADIENTVNEAAILAVRRGRRDISMAEFQEAAEKAIAGPERKSRVISAHEKRVIAYHEVGHALAMHHTVGSDPVLKISIISRGMALGYTMPLPEDRVLLSKSYLEGQIVGLLGGRAAEEIVFGENLITTGASNDFQRASDYAQRMVTEWGMSAKVGVRSFAQTPRSEFDFRTGKDYSEQLAQAIDAEIAEILARGYASAKNIINRNRQQLERVVARLLVVETIGREEFLQLLSQE